MTATGTPLTVMVNATTLVKGGAIQVAASFINEAIADRESSGINWQFVVSKEVAAEIKDQSAITEVFDETPAKSKPARAKILETESRLNPDVIFTVFGPAYVKFVRPHLLGVADCWVTHSTWQAFRSMVNPVKMLRTFMLMVYKSWWFRYADSWVVEATIARDGMGSRIGIPGDKVAVVPNTCSQFFNGVENKASTPPAPGEKLRLVYLTSYYKHKNFEIIPRTAAAIARKNPDLDFEFVMTLAEGSEGQKIIEGMAEELGVADKICNNGPVAMSDAPALYQSCHIAFMPSLLETFSANYPEAMVTGRLLLASDLKFSRACCHQGAAYFPAEDPEAAADIILDFVNSPERWAAQVAAGFERLAELPTAKGRYEGYTDLIRKLAKEKA